MQFSEYLDILRAHGHGSAEERTALDRYYCRNVGTIPTTRSALSELVVYDPLDAIAKKIEEDKTNMDLVSRRAESPRERRGRGGYGLRSERGYVHKVGQGPQRYGGPVRREKGVEKEKEKEEKISGFFSPPRHTGSAYRSVVIRDAASSSSSASSSSYYEYYPSSPAVSPQDPGYSPTSPGFSSLRTPDYSPYSPSYVTSPSYSPTNSPASPTYSPLPSGSLATSPSYSPRNPRMTSFSPRLLPQYSPTSPIFSPEYNHRRMAFISD